MLFQYYFIFSAPNLEFPEHYRNIINPVLFTSYRFIILSFLQISLSFSIFCLSDQSHPTPSFLLFSLPKGVSRLQSIICLHVTCVGWESSHFYAIRQHSKYFVIMLLSSKGNLNFGIFSLWASIFYLKKKHYRLIPIFWASFVITTLIFHTENLTLIFLIYLNVFQNITLILLQIFKLSMIRKNLKVIKIHFIPLFCHQNSYLKRRKIELWYFW